MKEKITKEKIPDALLNHCVFAFSPLSFVPEGILFEYEVYRLKFSFTSSIEFDITEMQ